MTLALLVERRGICHLAICLTLAMTGCSSIGVGERLRAEQPCSSETAPATTMTGVHTAKVTVPGQPFGVVTSQDTAWAFVSLGASVGVFANDSFLPRLVGQVPVPGNALGEVLTGDGRLLIVADGSGVDVIDVAAATRGDPNPLAGMLRAPGGRDGGDAIEVAVSRDDRYVFVTRENSNDLAVFDLDKARLEGYGPSAFVSSVALGSSPVGIALSPDGRHLYVTSQAGGAPSTSPNGGPPGTQSHDEGSVSVVDVAKTVSDPAAAVVSNVLAGCNPVRIVVTADGKTLWVTARASNAVLGFSAGKALSDPQHALLALVRVGQAPVGLALFRHDTRLLVADSNRFSSPGSAADLGVVDTGAALRGRAAVLGTIASGAFPRQFAVGPDGRVLVTNYASAELQAVDASTIP